MTKGGPEVRVRIRLNGALVSRLGRDRLALELPAGATVGDLVRTIGAESPEAVSLIERAVAVIGGRHVPLAQPLADGDEVALLLPIAGGSV